MKLPILMAHHQLLSDEVAYFEDLKGYDHNQDVMGCRFGNCQDDSDEPSSFCLQRK